MKEVKRPVVSVVVPVYNTEPFLAECLHSLEKQTLTDIEIILVNDGSTDNSGRLLREYADKDARFVYVGTGESRALCCTKYRNGTCLRALSGISGQ